jgi:hypothetical protein
MEYSPVSSVMGYTLDADSEDSDDRGEELSDLSLCNVVVWVIVSARERETKRPLSRGWYFQFEASVDRMVVGIEGHDVTT